VLHHVDEICSAPDPAAKPHCEELIDELRESFSIVIGTDTKQQAARVLSPSVLRPLGFPVGRCG